MGQRPVHAALLGKQVRSVHGVRQNARAGISARRLDLIDDCIEAGLAGGEVVPSPFAMPGYPLSGPQIVMTIWRHDGKRVGTPGPGSRGAPAAGLALRRAVPAYCRAGGAGKSSPGGVGAGEVDMALNGLRRLSRSLGPVVLVCLVLAPAASHSADRERYTCENPKRRRNSIRMILNLSA